MARWFGEATAEDIAKISARNRGRRVSLTDRTPSPRATEQPPSDSRPVSCVPSPIPKAKPAPRKPQKSRYKPPAVREADVLRACQGVLEAHPRVALWWRQNVTVSRYGDQYVKFGFRGASDLMGVMVGGRYLAVECKATGKKATPEQQAFLDNVRDAGGLAICTDNPDSLLLLLNKQ